MNAHGNCSQPNGDFSFPPGHFKAGFGKKNEVIIPAMGWASDPAEVRNLADRKEGLYRELVATEGVAVPPGPASF